ncbi:MAG TPA: hypothetical protein VNZ26_29625 [Vicinamibacterales bacterium]|jgi:hypothetical protein|nr:hypothetical protein [Vicinamibacterales bacterium]
MVNKTVNLADVLAKCLPTPEQEADEPLKGFTLSRGDWKVLYDAITLGDSDQSDRLELVEAEKRDAAVHELRTMRAAVRAHFREPARRGQPRKTLSHVQHAQLLQTRERVRPQVARILAESDRALQRAMFVELVRFEAPTARVARVHDLARRWTKSDDVAPIAKKADDVIRDLLVLKFPKLSAHQAQHVRR